MKLLNTIEFAPYNYAKEEHKSPKSEDEDNLWYKYWKACLADSGILNLCPIGERSWLVDINNIDKETLNIFVQTTFEEEDYESIEKNIYGGIVITENEKILLTTNCCGDLSNLEEEWEKIFTSHNQEWQMLWIGHPFVYYRYSNNYIEFSEATNENADENTKMKFKVSIEWLRTNINEIKEKQDIFIRKIENILKK